MPLAVVDTNVWIYAADPADAIKQRQAERLVDSLRARGELAVTVQVLNEFYYVSTRPNRPPSLSHDDARGLVQAMALNSRVFPLTGQDTMRALEAVPRHGMSFWDALIWAVAKNNGVATIYTEDFEHDREVEGVRFVNPFDLPAEAELDSVPSSSRQREIYYERFQPLIRSLVNQYGTDADIREELPGELYSRYNALLDKFDFQRGEPLAPYVIRNPTAAAYTFARSRWRRD